MRLELKINTPGGDTVGLNTHTHTHTHTHRERERERVIFIAYVSYQVVGVDNLYLKHGGTFVCNCCTITAVFVARV